MRSFIVAGLLAACLGPCLAAPALAQTQCRITNTADGKTSTVSGEITGTTLDKLITANGPVVGRLTMAAGTSYEALNGKAPEMTTYLAGQSVPDKDWRQPGTVQTEEGGISVSWPGFTLKGARVRSVTAAFSQGYATIRGTAQHPKGYKGADAFLLPVHWNVRSLKAGAMLELNYEMMNRWRGAFDGAMPLKIDVFDEAAGTQIATIEFNYPSKQTTGVRLVSDVNALRKAVADKTCK